MCYDLPASRDWRYAALENCGAGDLVGTPAGQIVGNMNAVHCLRDVMDELVRGFADAAERISAVAGALGRDSAPAKER